MSLERKTPLRARTRMKTRRDAPRRTSHPMQLPRDAEVSPEALALLARAAAEAAASGPVDVGEAEAKRITQERSNGVCEGCGMARGTDFAHRIGAAQGGLWCPSNGLRLCRVDCHGWSHRYPTEAKERGWMLHPSQDPTQVPARHWFYGPILLRRDGGITLT